jgi:hypothetical protein
VHTRGSRGIDSDAQTKHSTPWVQPSVTSLLHEGDIHHDGGAMLAELTMQVHAEVTLSVGQLWSAPASISVSCVRRCHMGC